MKKIKLAALLMTLLLCMACGGKQTKGKIVSVTIEPQRFFAERIADHFDFRKYFDIIIGSELDGTRIDKAEVIKEALRQAGDPSPERCIMIGDRVHDVVGAKKTGLPCIGVLYGYGSREELEEAGADVIVDSVTELHEYLIK